MGPIPNQPPKYGPQGQGHPQGIPSGVPYDPSPSGMGANQSPVPSQPVNHGMLPPMHHPSSKSPSGAGMDLLPPPPLPVPVPSPSRGPPVVLPQAKIQNSRSNYICGLKGSPANINALTIPPNGILGGPNGGAHVRSKRVVGGSDSYPGEWCWQVALINR